MPDLGIFVELCRRGVISPAQFISALGELLATQQPIGQMALHERMLGSVELFEVLTQQANDRRSFGEIAVERRFLTENQVAWLLYRQQQQADSLGRILVRQGALTSEDLTRYVLDVRRQLHAMGGAARKPSASPVQVNRPETTAS